MAHLYQLYNVLVGGLSAVGLLYLAWSQRSGVGYRRFFDLLIAGFLVFAVGGPVTDIVAPSLNHAVHGLAAVLVSLGLYDPVRNDLRKDEWTRLLLREPASLRQPGAWMTPMDDEILELFHSVHLVLTPSIIAYNIDRSREETNRRVSALEEHDLLERIERGKYRITPLGEEYLHGGRAGDPPASPD